MTFLSFLLCIMIIWFYDWSKKDWLGIETIKSLKDYGGGHSAGRMTSWFLRRSEPVAFLFLTFWYDAFITMAYLRRGAYNGMGARDWRIFLISLFLGNGYWILASWMGGEPLGVSLGPRGIYAAEPLGGDRSHLR
jgi:hypothetical protein